MLIVKSFDVPEYLGGFVLTQNTVKLIAKSLADEAIIQMRPRGDGVPKRAIPLWRTMLRINPACLGTSGAYFEARCVGCWKMPCYSGKKDCRRTRDI